jgi:hypothetical protein
MDVTSIITELQNRVAKGRSEIARHQRAIEELNASIADAEVTLRTLRSMGIAEGDDKPATATRPQATTLSIPDMIFGVLSDNAYNLDLGLEPADILQEIKRLYGAEPDPNNVRPALWRLAKSGRLTKDGNRYRLPDNEKPADEIPGEEPPAGFDQPEAQGREAGPGGGA